MNKDFGSWHALKCKVHDHDGVVAQCKTREVWWVCLGINIGFEQDGKNANLERPVLVLKRYNSHLFLGIPLTSKNKDNKYHFPLEYNGVPSNAILSQVRAFSSKRLLNKVGVVPIDMFNSLRFKFIEEVLSDKK